MKNPTSIQRVDPRAAPVELAGADRGDRLLEVVAGVDGALLRVDEAREPRLLVAVQHVHARRRPDPEHEGDHDRHEGAEHGELPPRRPRHEQHRGERSRVHERRAEVRLREHEQDRDEAEPDRAQRRRRVGRVACAFRHEAGDREDEQELPELRGLEREEADVDPPRRAARGAADDEHDRDQADRPEEDRAPQPAVQVGIEQQADRERDDADAHVDDLALDVVVRVARHVEAGDARDRPQADGHEPGDAGDEQPVEGPEHAGERDALVAVPLQSGSL